MDVHIVQCKKLLCVCVCAVAKRVAEERGEGLGHSVGFQIRLENRLPAESRGSILYCTTGILLRRMINDP